MINSKNMIQDTYLPGAAAALYTVPAGYRDVVKEIILCNTDVNPIVISIYYLKNAGTLAKGTILDSVSLNAHETKTLSLSSVLNAGDAIEGVAGTADKVAIYASGYEENV
jgi:hypothetical protein